MLALARVIKFKARQVHDNTTPMTYWKWYKHSIRKVFKNVLWVTIKHRQTQPVVSSEGWIIDIQAVFSFNHDCKTLRVIHIARISSITCYLHYVKLFSFVDNCIVKAFRQNQLKIIPSWLQICSYEQPITSSPKNQSILSPQCSNHQRSHQWEKRER